MTFLEFKNKMFDLACFNINQIYALRSDFDSLLHPKRHCLIRCFILWMK
jgi:hypothetical protein